MELDIAIKKKILSIRIQDKYPIEFTHSLKKDFQEMYVAGWEQGWLDAHQTTAKPIGQYNLEGKLINTYTSLRDACKKTGFSKNGILHSMKHNIPTRQRWLWAYIEKKKKEDALPDIL